jgi:formylglycine-generating enzyme required for sulfatase activity
MADALRYAWDSFQLLHRDIKPSNIMVDERGRVFLMDLGLAKSLAEESGFTLSGTILGTPHYMSPEQALGSSQLTVGTDIYSLGATLYHLVVGSPPFTADSALQVLNKHVHDPLPSPRERNPEISDGCDRMIHVMMAKKVEDRYGDWGALIRDIDRVLAGGLPEAVPPGAGDSMVRSSSASAGAPSARQAHDRVALARQAQEALARQHQAQVKSKAKQSVPATGEQPGRRRKMLIIGVATVAALALLGVIGVVLSRSGGHKVAGITSAGAEAPAVKTPGDQTDRTDGKNGKNGKNGENGKNGAGEARVTAGGVAPPETPPHQPPNTPETVTKTTQRPPWDRITLPHTGNWALEFDGQDDYVEIPTLKPDWQSAATIEVVATPALATGEKTGFLVADLDGGGIALSLGDRVGFSCYDKGGMFDAGSRACVLAGRPLHVVTVVERTSVTVYVNGTKAFSKDRENWPRPCRNGCPLSLGANPRSGKPPDGWWLNGTIQCVRITRGIRYTQEFTVEEALPLKADGDTLCLLDFEEGEGDVAKDLSGNGHDGQIHGATWKRMWPCPVSEEKLREVEEELRKANPKAPRCSLFAEGFLDGARVRADNGTGVSDISALSGLKLTGLSLRNTSVSSLAALAGQPIRRLNIDGLSIKDLSPISGAPLVQLSMIRTTVADLSPLRGMPLHYLDAWGSQIGDLVPLRGMPLEFLHIRVTRVTDISPLQGLPLRWLDLPDAVRDITALKGMPLLWLIIGPEVPRIDMLAGMPLRALRIDAGALDDLTPLKSLPSLRYLYITNQRAALPALPGVVINPRVPTSRDFQCEILHEVHRDLEVSLGWAAYAVPKPAMPFAEVAGSLLGQDFDRALRVLSTVSSQATGDDLACARTVCGMRKHVLDSFSSDVGKTVDVQLTKETLTCEIREVTDGTVKVQQLVKRGQMTGRVGRTFRYEDLSIQEKLRRLGSGDTPELNMQRGLLAMEAERPDIARRLFEKAGGTLANALVAELDRRNAEAAENAADRATPASPQPGEDWTVPDLGMEFVWIKALNLWVGKYEVTNAEYRAYKPDHDSKEFEGQSLNGDRQPVVYVNFDDACAYAAWLTAREEKAGRLSEGLRYRLPTEEEFRLYAQCADGRTYPWGNEWPPQSGRAGNYHGAEGADNEREKISGYSDGHPVTCAVEQSWVNPWGLYGVSGNVWEACARDTAIEQCFGAWRGASWYNFNQGDLRCDFRSRRVGSFRFFNFGFRLVVCSR